MLKGLLVQLVRFSPDHISYVYEQVSMTAERVVDSPYTLMMMIETILEPIGQVWMILDGLDECEKKERKKILSWISKIISGQSSAHVQVLVTSQDKSDIRHTLTTISNCPTISLRDPGHEGDIRSYVSRKVAKRKQQFDLTSEVEQDIVHKVTRHANGKLYLLFKLCLSMHQTSGPGANNNRHVSFCASGFRPHEEPRDFRTTWERTC